VQMLEKLTAGFWLASGIDRAQLTGMLRSVLVLHAAELLGVSRRTVYYWIRAGSLKTVRTRCGSQRVLMESIEAALRQQIVAVRVPGAGVSDTGPSGRCPAPSPRRPPCRDVRETPL
jgi:excisionase family DNA binding protein